MKKNFFIEIGGIDLNSEGRHYDLHNIYDFYDLKISASSNLLIRFSVNSECLDLSKGTEYVYLNFEGIRCFEISKGFWAGRSKDVAEIGYKKPDDTDYEWLLTEEQASEEDHLIIRFENQEYLRVFSDRANVLAQL